MTPTGFEPVGVRRFGDVRIREVRPEEWPMWRALRLRALAADPEAFGTTLAEAQARGEEVWRAATAPRPERVPLVAERGGAPVGMAVPFLDAEDPRRGHLFSMWVAPEARRSGAGRALVAAALAWTRRRARRELRLEVAEANAAGRALYRGCGFRETGERAPIREGEPAQSVRMVAPLPPLVMGVVNVTPDSFSDGGRHADPAAAIAHGLALVRDGADLLDVGGEATNPRATPIDAAEELRRVLPVIEGLTAAGATVSIDTTKAAVARAAVAAGASIVNDVSGGLFDPDMASAIAELDATYIAGHLRGANLAEVFAPERAPGGADLTWRDVAAELTSRLAALPPAARARAWADPGLGFGKGADPALNLELLRRSADLGRAIGAPIVVGPSRKRFLRRAVAAGGAALAADRAALAALLAARPPGSGDDGAAALDPGTRASIGTGTGTGAADADPMAPGPLALDVASIAACLAAVREGAQVLRVHNVALLRAALAVYTSI